MPEPINYMGMFPQVNPMQGLLSGIQVGSALRETGLRTQEIQQKLDQEAAAQKRLELYRTQFADYMADPKFEKLQNLRASFPEQKDAFAPLIEQMDKRQLALEQSSGVQITNALKNNNTELASKIIDESIEAAKNSGLNTMAFEQVKKAMDTDPTAALGLTQWLTMHMMTPEQQEKYAEAQKKLEDLRQSQALFPEKQAQEAIKTQKEGYETAIKAEEAEQAPVVEKAKAREQVAKAVAEEWTARYAPLMKEAGLSLNRAQISNISSQIADRSARFNLDAQKINLDMAEKLNKLSNKAANLPAPALKMVNDAAISSAASAQTAAQFGALADKMERLPSWSGYAGGAAEYLKKAAGMQNGVTELKKEYLRLRNDAVIKSLPPGPATDRDIQIFAAGFPDEDANPKVLSSFLRGMAKMQRISSKVDEAKADWVTETGGSLGRSRSEFVAGGYKVKPGQSFGEFSQSVARAIQIKEQKASTAGVRAINPPAPKVPTAKTQKIFDKADAIIYGGR